METLKIVFIGDTDVGKTNIIARYTTGHFRHEHDPTVGAGFKSKEIHRGERCLVLNIWDTAGQDRFRSVAQLFYRDAQAIVIVYDVTKPDSLDSVTCWRDEVFNIGSKKALVVIVGNKADLGEQEKSDPIQEYAKSIGALYLKTSALTSVGIEDLFEEIVRQLLTDPSLSEKNESITLDRTMLRRSDNCC